MSNCKRLNVIELFGGIGACTQALKRLGYDVNVVDYVEINQFAVKSYNAMNNTDFKPQDISEWDKDFKDIDIIMHGSPCQDFSLRGKQASAYFVEDENGEKRAGETRSSLMYETLRIVKKIKPRIVVWENVANLLSEKHFPNFMNYINMIGELGYASAWKVINSKDMGIPQNRERVFTISVLNGPTKDLFGYDLDYDFPKPKKLELRLKDMLEEKVDEKYYLSDQMIKYISAPGTGSFRNNESKINLDTSRTLTCKEGIYRVGTSTYIGDNIPNNFNLSDLPFCDDKNK